MNGWQLNGLSATLAAELVCSGRSPVTFSTLTREPTVAINEFGTAWDAAMRTTFAGEIREARPYEVVDAGAGDFPLFHRLIAVIAVS